MKPPFSRKLLRFAAIGILLTGCTAESKKESAGVKARAYFAKGEYDKASIEFQNVLSIDPKDARALEHLGLIWLERGAPLRALQYFLQVRQVEPTSTAVHLKILRIMLSVGRTADVRKEAGEILERAPNQGEAMLLLAEAVRSADDLKAAQARLGAMADQTSHWYHLASANLALHRGDVVTTRTGLRRALAVEPNSPDAHLAMARHYLRENKRTEADNEFKVAAELAPVRSPIRIAYAEHLVRSGKAQEAEAYLKEIAQRAPDNVRPWSALAEIALSRRKPDEALGHLKNGIDRDPASYECRLLRARAWLAKGEVDQAIEDIVKLGKAYPGLSADKELLARAYLQKREPKLATAALEQAVAANPENDAAAFTLAELNLAAGKSDVVVTDMLTVLYRQPNNERALLLFLSAMEAQGRTEEVVKLLRDAALRAPENPKAHYVLGTVLARKGDLEEARRAFERVQKLGSTPGLAESELVALDVREKNFAAATKRAQDFLTANPNSSVAQILLAKILGAQSRWDEAEPIVLQAIEANPANAYAYTLLADAFKARRREPDVVARMERFLAERPDDFNAVALAASVYLATNQPEKARVAYEKQLAQQPENFTVLNNLAYLYSERLNQPARARELAQQARHIAPQSPDIADTLGWILAKEGQYEQALPLLQESAKQRPGHGEIHYHLGVAYQKLGKRDEARTALKAAAQAAGDFPGKQEIGSRLAQLDQP